MHCDGGRYVSGVLFLTGGITATSTVLSVCVGLSVISVVRVKNLQTELRVGPGKALRFLLAKWKLAFKKSQKWVFFLLMEYSNWGALQLDLDNETRFKIYHFLLNRSLEVFRSIVGFILFVFLHWFALLAFFCLAGALFKFGSNWNGWRCLPLVRTALVSVLAASEVISELRESSKRTLALQLAKRLQQEGPRRQPPSAPRPAVVPPGRLAAHDGADGARRPATAGRAVGLGPEAPPVCSRR